MSRDRISGAALLEHERQSTLEGARDSWVLLRTGRPRAMVRVIALGSGIVVATVAKADDSRVEGPVAVGAGPTPADTLRQVLELRTCPEALAAARAVIDRLPPEDQLWLRAHHTPQEEP